jgi:hypothetical protein
MDASRMSGEKGFEYQGILARGRRYGILDCVLGVEVQP